MLNILLAIMSITPEETALLLHTCALFEPSATAVKHIVEETGAFLDTQAEEIHQAIRQHETAPAKTKVLVASLDGVNVRVTEPGNKRGRPQERPGNQTDKTTPTA